MLLEITLLILGLIALVYGAELLVKGATNLALRLGISTFVVGLTVVAFGTSAPELCVSLSAAFRGSADVAIGNVLGSNLFNMLIVIGLAGFVAPFRVSPAVTRREMPIMIAVLGAFWYLASTGTITRTAGVVLFSLLLIYIAMNYYIAKSKKLSINKLVDEIEFSGFSNSKSFLYILFGLGSMVLGSELVVASATTIARAVGISELVIGISLVAIGTSLPEIATTLVAARKGEPELVVGNAIGSNIFNVLCVIGFTSIITPLEVNPAALKIDFPFMFYGCAAVLPLMMFRRQMTRLEGTVMLFGYAAYMIVLIKGIG